jgi:hypothetical protein
MTVINNKLIADDGMTLTNGEAFGKVVYLANGDDGSKWYEITDEEAAQMTSDPAEEADYIASLERFGV